MLILFLILIQFSFSKKLNFLNTDFIINIKKLIILLFSSIVSNGLVSLIVLLSVVFVVSIVDLYILVELLELLELLESLEFSEISSIELNNG